MHARAITPMTPVRTAWPPVVKRPADLRVLRRISSTTTGARASSRGREARADLDGLPGGRGLNIAHEAVDRHAAGARARPRRAALAVARTARGATSPTPTCATRPAASPTCCRRSASARATPVAVLAGRIPELYIAALGTLKNGSVFTPLFSAFGPEPIQARITIARARVLVTTDALYRKKVEALRASLPASSTCSLVGDAGRRQRCRARAIFARCWPRPTTASRFRRPIRKTPRCCTSPAAPPASRRARCTCIEAVVAHHATARFALDFHPGRRLLVHGRSRLGDRHVLRHHRAAHARRHEHRRRSGLRRRALVSHPPATSTSPSGTPRRRRSAC